MLFPSRFYETRKRYGNLEATLVIVTNIKYLSKHVVPHHGLDTEFFDSWSHFEYMIKEQIVCCPFAEDHSRFAPVTSEKFYDAKFYRS